jgi:hypothetical protein
VRVRIPIGDTLPTQIHAIPDEMAQKDVSTTVLLDEDPKVMNKSYMII